MTIRNRLTLWYGGILAVSLTVLAFVLHYEWQEQASRILNRQNPEAAWHEVGEIVLSYGLPTALLLMIGGWFLVKRALEPVITLTKAAKRIDLNNLRERLPLSASDDELDRLKEVFNGMMGRLEDSFSRVREFTLHASHELRTPLTIMRGEIESALLNPRAKSTDPEMLASLLDEIQRLSRIVDGLTLLAKADAGQLPVKEEPVRFDLLARDSFADAQILARPMALQVSMNRCDEVTVRGDRHRLRQLLLNLTDNAIKYNHPGGSLTFDLHASGEIAEFTIINSGPGIAPDILPRVFDRFFRGDASHSDAVEGCGLGLTIAQWIVRAHQGRIDIASVAGQSTTVTVSFPLAKTALADSQ